jgi:hypothetical protein
MISTGRSNYPENLKKFLFLVMVAILDGGRGYWTYFLKVWDFL